MSDRRGNDQPGDRTAPMPPSAANGAAVGEGLAAAPAPASTPVAANAPEQKPQLQVSAEAPPRPRQLRALGRRGGAPQFSARFAPAVAQAPQMPAPGEAAAAPVAAVAKASPEGTPAGAASLSGPSGPAPVVGGLDEVAGRYEPLHPATLEPVGADAAELARGGMGRILCAFDRFTNRTVAIKERLGAADSGRPVGAATLSSADARFLREASITAQLEHPHIVPIYEIGRRENGRLYYTMRRIRGRTLAACLSECETLAERMEYMHHFHDLCNAIAFAHARGVIHRDIKSENVMIGEFGETVVLDWGLAKILGVKEEGDSENAEEDVLAERVQMLAGDTAHSIAGLAMGTPAYLPPEQAEGKLDEIDRRSDVYSLGAVLYEILTGRTPFSGDSVHEILSQVIAAEPPPIASIEKRAPRELIAIAKTAMSKDRDHRFLDASEMAACVGQYLSGKFVPPPQGGAWARAAYLWRAQRAHVLWTGAVLMVAIAAALTHVVLSSGLSSRVAALTLDVSDGERRLLQQRRRTDELMASLLLLQADAYSGTPLGLTFAARAVMLEDTEEGRERLHREAVARPYGVAAGGALVESRCRFIGPLDGALETVACFTVAPTADDGHLPFVQSADEYVPRLHALDLREHGPPLARTLAFAPRSAVRLAEGTLLVGDDHGQLHQIDAEGQERFTLALAVAQPVTLLARGGSPDLIAAADATGVVYLLSADARSVRKRLGAVARGPLRALHVVDGEGGAPVILAATRQAFFRVSLDSGRSERVAALCPERSQRGADLEPAVALDEAADGSVLMATSCAPETIAVARLVGGRFVTVRNVGIPLGEVVTALAVSADEHRVYFGTRAGSVGEVVGPDAWWVRSVAGHGGAVEDLAMAGDLLLSSGADGFVKQWRDLGGALSAQSALAVAVPGAPQDVSTSRWVLTQLKDAVLLVDADGARAPKRLPLTGAVASRFSPDGALVLVLRSVNGAAVLSAVGVGGSDAAATEDWPMPIADATTLIILPASGRSLAAVANDAGELAIIDYREKSVVAAPRKWGRSAVTKVIADAYAVTLGVLHADGTLAVGPVTGGEPTWTEAKMKLRDITVTADGHWLVLGDDAGRLWATSLLRPASLTAPCAAEGHEAPSAGDGGPASCLTPPGASGEVALAPLDARRVLVVGPGGFVVYDLFLGKSVGGARMVGSARSILGSSGDLVLATSRREGGASTRVVPVSRWVFDEPSSFVDRIKGATGYVMEEGDLRPLGPAEWAALAKATSERAHR